MKYLIYRLIKGRKWWEESSEVTATTWPTANEPMIPTKSSSPIISRVTRRKKEREIGFCRIPRAFKLGQYAGVARFFLGVVFSSHFYRASRCANEHLWKTVRLSVKSYCFFPSFSDLMILPWICLASLSLISYLHWFPLKCTCHLFFLFSLIDG